MARFVDRLRSGAWLTRERMRLVALAVLVAGLARRRLRRRHLERAERPLRPPARHRFFQRLRRRHLVLDGHAGGAVRSGHRITPASRKSSAPARRITAGSYPPFFRSVAAALALLPYLLALLLWQGVTLGLYLWAMRAIFSLRHGERRPCALPRRHGLALGDCLGNDWLLLAAAFPAVFVNLGHGQNGFLTAASVRRGLGACSTAARCSPAFCSVCSSYKPQFGLHDPAGACWRPGAGARSPPPPRPSARSSLAVTRRLRRAEVWQRFLRRHASSPAASCSNRATPAGTRSRACSPGCACGAAASSWPTRRKSRSALAVAAALVWLWRSAARLSAQGRGAADRHRCWRRPTASTTT